MTLKKPNVYIPGLQGINPWIETKDYLMIAIGTLMYSFGQVVFMLPYGLTSGGVSGVSAIVYYVTNMSGHPIEIQITYATINVVFLIAAVTVLGLKFCLKTIC